MRLKSLWPVVQPRLARLCFFEQLRCCPTIPQAKVLGDTVAWIVSQNPDVRGKVAVINRPVSQDSVVQCMERNLILVSVSRHDRLPLFREGAADGLQDLDNVIPKESSKVGSSP